MGYDYGLDGDQDVIGASSRLPQHTGCPGSEWSAEDRTGLASAIESQVYHNGGN